MFPIQKVYFGNKYVIITIWFKINKAMIIIQFIYKSNDHMLYEISDISDIMHALWSLILYIWLIAWFTQFFEFDLQQISNSLNIFSKYCWIACIVFIIFM